MADRVLMRRYRSLYRNHDIRTYVVCHTADWAAVLRNHHTVAAEAESSHTVLEAVEAAIPAVVVLVDSPDSFVDCKIYQSCTR